MYESKRKQLRRVGATDHCIVCGMPDLPGVLAFAHIHADDLDLSPGMDPARVFRLCWHHHHGCYDQGYISTAELLEAEAVWIENVHRPEPHPRDIELMRRVTAGEVVRDCDWTKVKVGRGLHTPDIKRSIAALKAHATRWEQRAASATTEAGKANCMARKAEYLDRANRMQTRDR